MHFIGLLTKQMSLPDAMKLAGKLPRELNKIPYNGLVWDNTTKRILNSGSHKVTLRKILLYMVGQSDTAKKDLIERYRRDLGDIAEELPATIS